MMQKVVSEPAAAIVVVAAVLVVVWLLLQQIQIHYSHLTGGVKPGKKSPKKRGEG
jgi:hypothetical protein